MKLYKKLKQYWTLKKPVELKHREWNGEVIIPIHADKDQKNKVSDF